MLISCTKNKETNRKNKPLPPKYLFGYNLNDFDVLHQKVKDGETFGVILDRNHVEPSEVYQIVERVKTKFDVQMIKPGQHYMVLRTKKSTKKAQVIIYQHDLISYSIIDLKDSLKTRKINKPIKLVVKSAGGIIDGSLSESLSSKNVDPVVANTMGDIFQWTINFFKVKKNDKFKVIYEQKYVDDTIPVGIGQIKAAYFKHDNKPYYAFRYLLDSTKGKPEYYDEKANFLRKAFLKAPLQFSRISSRYNLNRFISFYGKVKPHLGTDFAAPVGTPILSTANGTVLEAGYRGGNGNYVKIRHRNNYDTGYLHMSRVNVNVGQSVKQGDVIGWIGMTGNTSGPHVCYRFWKNGVQVDPLKEKLPNAEPLPEEYKSTYLNYIKPLKKKIDAIKYK